MRKFIDKVKHHLEDASHHGGSQTAAYVSPTAGFAAAAGPFPNARDWYMYRKQRGVNLGSWFVLERWIADSPFRNAVAPAQSDLDVAKGDHARETLERHWDTWITEPDWAWLAGNGINTVRIPIGYYHICGADPGVLAGTDFADLDHVFAGAWARVTNALATAHRYGIGVLFDLHAAPGKQNGDAHSGTSLEPAFFKHSRNMDHALRVLSALVTHLTAFTRSHDPPLPNLVGIELLNEPAPNGHDDALKRWYKETFRVLRSIDPDLPLYIGDAWRTDDYAEFVKSAGTPAVVLDHHLYRCFTKEDITTPAAEHARRLRDGNDGTVQTFARVSGELEGAGGALVVGEWSAALNPGSLHGAPDERAAKRGFVEAQLQLYEAHCAGWFFWTYKKENGRDTGWSFRDALEGGVVPPDFRRRSGPAARPAEHDPARDARMAQARDKALAEHAGYWQQYPGHYEHWRFADGFARGWSDAYLFAALAPPGSKFAEEIGFVGPWTKRRAREHVAQKGDASIWEFEHGFKQGLRAATADMAAAP
ncbi:glycoside hydrolase family 5 protein [Trametes coccinea BRFM310]|uniref:Glycoside hydrolase family 5 protein n=1 Tax=Trametes coccinea (strain BRFM310) TaxID=1353009 RepID=A0A1Y2IV69_TRAC3|nr:glycoside hydrolase family 5 protein [Trametes coccinea BRFM310]